MRSSEVFLSSWIVSTVFFGLSGCTDLKEGETVKTDSGNGVFVVESIEDETRIYTTNGNQPDGHVPDSRTPDLADQTTRSVIVDAQLDVPQTDNQANNSQTTTCTNDGELRCKNGANREREVCQSGQWVATDPCVENEVCLTDSDGTSGLCESMLSLCIGNTNGFFCSAEVMHHCSEDGLSTETQDCGNERLCQAGLAFGECAVCSPNAYQCTDRQLERCSEDGKQWFSEEVCPTADLCNADIGACTDATCLAEGKRCNGDTLEICNDAQTAFQFLEQCDHDLCDQVNQECDICYPGERTCNNDTTVSTCAPDGQSFNNQDCPSNTPHCTGNGTCLECITDRHCSDPGECKRAVCNGGQCAITSEPERSRCSLGGLFGGSGLCTDTGECVECLDLGDPCSSGVCNASHSCVECNQPGDCPGTVGECEEKVCFLGNCSVRSKDSGTRCSTGRCNGASSCVACLSNSDCGDTSKYYCDRGDCKLICGNKIIDDGEDCEINVNGWTSSTCNGSTCRQSVYIKNRTIGCNPSGNSTGPGSCPLIPGFDILCGVIVGTGNCEINCNFSNDCPVGWICVSHGIPDDDSFDFIKTGFCQ